MARRPQRGGGYEGFGTAWNVIATLLAGMLIWGGLGWLLDRWLDTARLFTAIGLLVGTAGGIYVVYVRYGRDQQE
jgi:ATP synthase protein I